MTDKIGIFSFFSGAGFLDLGFELAGGYKVLFVNEFHKPFMDTYKYSREKMGIEIPEFGYHLGDVAKYLEADQVKELKTELKNANEKCKLVGFIGGPPCPDFSVGGKNKLSTPSVNKRFNAASCNSYSKSVVVRTPRIMAVIFLDLISFASKSENPNTSTLGK